jgi:predicted nucleotidyltransferase
MKLKEKIRKLINDNQDVIRQYGIMRLGLFGSVIRGEEKENSDIDLIADFQPGMKNYDNFIDLCFFLEDMFDRKVDLLTFDGISPIIRKNIEREIEYVKIVS